MNDSCTKKILTAKSISVDPNMQIILYSTFIWQDAGIDSLEALSYYVTASLLNNQRSWVMFIPLYNIEGINCAVSKIISIRSNPSPNIGHH